MVLDLDGREREVDLVLDDPAATVADLVAVVCAPDPPPPGVGIEVEGTFAAPDHGLDEVPLPEGAVVRLATAAPRPAGPRDGPPVTVVEGPTAGATVWLDARAASIGRDPGCDVVVDDPTVSEWHAELAPGADGGWVVRDLGSRNGTWVDGVAAAPELPLATDATVRVGATHLRLRGATADDRPLGIDPRPGQPLVPFNRPPRAALPPDVAPVALPSPPEVTSRARNLSIAAVVAPLVLGGALVAITGQIRFALFLLLSPVMAIGTWLSSRRQVRKDTRSSSRAFRQALATLERELDEQAARERARREHRLPDLAEVVRRVTTPSSRLWERRPGHDDVLRLRVGLGDVPWDPPVDEPRDGVDPEVAERLDAARLLRRAPVEVDLSRGGVVGLVGDRSAAVALARSLVCQAAVHHGPADLGVAVLTDPARRRDWSWSTWLPHVRDPGGEGRLLAGDPDTATALLEALLGAADERGRGPGRRPRVSSADDAEVAGRTRLVVLDDVSLLQGRRAPARRVLRGDAGPVAGIVLADTVDQLPAVTTTVIELASPLGDASLRRPADGLEVAELVIGGVSDARARELARRLARYEDPELEVVGATVPRTVRLLPVLGMDELTADAVRAAWRTGLPDPPPATPIGVGEDGVLTLDLAADGPHGLIGGTTGSGKSELLRSLVAGLAARVDPDHLTFVLVDYKGGSAFDRCAELPHTVGLVTDLDEHLGQRALRSLEAELRHRERVLRDAGTQDLPAYLAAGAPAGPLPRLVVVIDEFATLAAELPDFLGALVGIAQRGRSLGVHLLLATQRPSGAVDANVKANTNVRIALRVQDPADSTDIIDRPDAAALPRTVPGRAYVRLGPTDVVLVQTALSTGVADEADLAPLQLLPVVFGPRPAAPTRRAGDGPSDLDRLVATIDAAANEAGVAPPRRPWLPPLPDHVDLEDLLAGRSAASGSTGPAVATGPTDVTGDAASAPLGEVPLGRADDPDRQRQLPVGWDPAQGHLAVFGTVGSGTTTALTTVVAALAASTTPDRCHVHAMDLGAGGLAPLRDLPHVGTVVGATATELRDRLLRHLRRELDRRRDLSPEELAAAPLVVVAVDGIGSLLTEFEAPDQLAAGDGFRRLFADGPTARIVFAVAGTRVGELPMRLGASVARRIVLEHADPQDLAGIGVRAADLPAFVPGRGLDAGSRRELQVAWPAAVLARLAAAARAADAESPGGTDGADGPHAGSTGAAASGVPGAGPIRLRPLPRQVAVGALPAARRDGELVVLPVGLREEDLTPASLRLGPGDHVLVTGPSRSGVSTALALLAHQLRAADPDAVLLGLCRQRSPLYGIDPLDGAGTLQDLAGIVRGATRDARRWYVLVDDAPAVADVEGALGGLLDGSRDDRHVVAGGRPDELRAGLSHWTRAVRRSRIGVLLSPNLVTDGELLGVTLPRRAPVELTVPGRGHLVVDGTPTLVQLAQPGTAGDDEHRTHPSEPRENEMVQDVANRPEVG